MIMITMLVAYTPLNTKGMVLVVMIMIIIMIMIIVIIIIIITVIITTVFLIWRKYISLKRPWRMPRLRNL